MGYLPSLVLGLALLAAWILFGLVIPVGAGWIHMLLALGVMLLVRAVVLKPAKTGESS